MKIDFYNIEKLIFEDLELQNKLFPLKNYFYQWKLGKIISCLKPTAQKSLLDVLNKLNEYKDILEEHFKEEVEIEQLEYTLVKNFSIKNEKCFEAEGFPAIYRDENSTYICMWR